jgi:DNA-binding response OmpR family regulator
MAQTILVADDEKNIVSLVRLYLTGEGYAVESVSDGQEAIEAARRLRPALVLLDVMLPKVDGWEVLRQLRAESSVPVVMLSARTEDIDKVVGLELGADDYVCKPFNPRELVARVKAVLRRAGQGASARRDAVVEVGDVSIDSSRREVRVDGTLVPLRNKEFELLLALAREPGRVVTRDSLLTRVWDYAMPGASRTVDVHVKFLRDKLAASRVEIQSVRGYGYKLVAAPAATTAA